MNKGIQVSNPIAKGLGILLLGDSISAVGQTTPEVEGVPSERLVRIGAALRSEVDKGTMPGAVTLIARHGRKDAAHSRR